MHYAFCYHCKKHLIVENDLSTCPICDWEIGLLSQCGMKQYTTKARVEVGITGAMKSTRTVSN